jgi:tRNA (guanine37-N1)-methyltransferase
MMSTAADTTIPTSAYSNDHRPSPGEPRADRILDGGAPGRKWSVRTSLGAMRVDVITIFPGLVHAVVGEGLLGKAIASGTIDVVVHDLRDRTQDRHRSVDDEPFGGGPGMVLKPEPLFAAVEALDPDRGRVLALSPAGRRLDQAFVRHLAEEPHLTLLCGRYEGFDERVIEGLPAEEVSIGDYVLGGGELPALVLLEAVGRLVPGVIGSAASHENDSFSESGRLDHPQYTRPAEFRGMRVPEVLLSGDHAEIARWRERAAREKTARNRPDLLEDSAR